MGLRELSTLLWEERQLLDLLLFKLEEESLILSSGQHRWLARATSEVEFVLERIKEMEVTREAEAAILAADLGVQGRATLEVLADSAPEPWAGTLREHRRAFQTLMAKIQDVSARNRDVLARYLLAVSDALAIAGAKDGPAYDRSGAERSHQLSSSLLDASA